jgi:hypothetical protein
LIASPCFGDYLTLDAVSCALRNESSVHLDCSPRMADFAQWAVAAEPALGLKEGEFMRAYVGNRESANDLALEASPLEKQLAAYDQNTFADRLSRLKYLHQIAITRL